LESFNVSFDTKIFFKAEKIEAYFNLFEIYLVFLHFSDLRYCFSDISQVQLWNKTFISVFEDGEVKNVMNEVIDKLCCRVNLFAAKSYPFVDIF